MCGIEAHLLDKKTVCNLIVMQFYLEMYLGSVS